MLKRALEIIEYSDELSNIIDNKQEIKVDSIYEVEIKASQIVVLEYIKSKLKSKKSIDIDSGCEIKDIAEVLGHKGIETTEKYYISSSKEDKIKVTKIFENEMNKLQ